MSSKICKCNIPDRSMKVSENGILAYCLKCSKQAGEIDNSWISGKEQGLGYVSFDAKLVERFEEYKKNNPL